MEHVGDKEAVGGELLRLEVSGRWTTGRPQRPRRAMQRLHDRCGRGFRRRTALARPSSTLTTAGVRLPLPSCVGSPAGHICC
jgi:hypothetical protein